MPEFPPGSLPPAGSESVLNELHRAVGRLEGKVDTLHENVGHLSRKISTKFDKIESEVADLQRFRSRVIGYWVGATAVVGAFVKWLPL